MKTLIIYYSRTGTTRRVAELLAEKLGADIEEIKDTKDRSGVIGYITSGRDAMKRRLTSLEPLRQDVARYGLVVIGTPVWAANISVPVRTFLSQQKSQLPAVAFFCTMGGNDPSRTFKEMEEICGKTPQVTLAIRTREVKQDICHQQVETFASALVAEGSR